MLDLLWILCIYFFYGGVNIKRTRKSDDNYINEHIKAAEVMVIGPNGEKMGVKNIKDARTLAEYAGFDLVMISSNSNPPVCKIMDYNKFKYEKQKQHKENMKKQREANLDLKEYRLSPTIDQHDLEVRVKQARKYLEKGHKVKGNIMLKGRRALVKHSDMAKEVLADFANQLSDVSEIESKPKQDGRFVTMILAPKKEK